MPQARLTNDNRKSAVTPGLPVRFDFGVKLPSGLIEGGTQAIEIELGTVLFDSGSAAMRERYLAVVDKMAEQVRAHGAGEVVIASNGESQALAYDRAKAVQTALLAKLSPQEAKALTISLRTDLEDPASTLLALGRCRTARHRVWARCLVKRSGDHQREYAAAARSGRSRHRSDDDRRWRCRDRRSRPCRPSRLR